MKLNFNSIECLDVNIKVHYKWLLKAAAKIFGTQKEEV